MTLQTLHEAADDGVDPAKTRADAAPRPGTPPVRLRLPLRTIDDVKAELARLYRDGKAGRRNVADVSRLANILGILGRLIEADEFDRRITALEGSAGGNDLDGG